MTITAKVINRLIDTGKVISLVQSQNQADTIVFQIRGEDAALESYYFYIMYKRPSDTIPHIQLLGQPSTTGDYPEVSFTPGSYFTAEDGTVRIQLLGCDAADLTVDPDTGTISGSTLWESLQGYIFVHASQLDATETIIEENVLTEYLAAFQELEGGSRTYASDAEEFARGTRSDGQTVPVVSDDVNDNAKYYKGKAKEWATKTGGPVEGVELSAKGYALVSESRANEAEGYAIGTKNGSPAPGFADKNAKDWAIKTGSTVDGTNYSAKQYALDAGESAAIVAAHATQIDAIADDLTKIDGVYAKLTEVEAVADDITKVTAVADDLTKIDGVYDDLSNIDAVQAKLTEIETVSDDIANVNTVAGSIANVNTVAGDKTNVDAVAGNKTNIDTVAGIAADVTAVAGIKADVEAVADIDDDVTDVAGIKADVSAVAAVASDIAAVADELTDIGTVATNIQDVSDVADDIAKVSAVADDLTNIDAVNANKTNIDTVATNIADISDVADDIAKVASVADDLTNIDAVADDLENIDDAVTNASLARQYAEGKKLDGTDVVSGEAGYEDNAKYYKEEIETHLNDIDVLKGNVQSLNGRVDNINAVLTGAVIQEHVDNTQKNVKTILSANELLPWAILKRVGARTTQFNQLVDNRNINTSTDHGVTFTKNADGTWSLSGTATGGDATKIISTVMTPIIGHYYLILGCPTGGSGTSFMIYGTGGSGFSDIGSGAIAHITTSVTTVMQILIREGVNTDGLVFRPQLFDLTAMNEYDSNKTDAENIASFRAKFSASYYPFNAGDIYDVPPLSFLCRGTNQWDEKWKHWAWNTDGTHYDVSSFIASENKIRVIPNQKYYFLYPNTGHNMVIYVWDREGNVLVSGGIGTDWTMPANAYEMVIMLDGYSTDYNNDIMVCLYSVTDKTYKPANHRTIDTSFMAGTKYVNSSCYDYAENVYVNGILKRKNQTVVGSVDLSQISFSQFSGVYYANLLSYGFKVRGALLCDKYFNSDKNFAELGEGEISSNNVGFGDAPYIFIKDSNGTPTGTLYYELATLPDPTYGDPIANFPCEDGSTIMANTPQTEIVNAIDVPSTIGYSTKIA